MASKCNGGPNRNSNTNAMATNWSDRTICKGEEK